MRTKMKPVFFLFIMILTVACKKDICPQLDDTLPMYGDIKKCKPQLLADEKFVDAVVEQYGSREEATNSMLRFAWRHYMEGNLNASIKRFNQAWLLDSLNTDVYKGFGNIMMDQGKDKESLRYFDKYLALDPANAEVLRLSALSYIHIYDEGREKDETLLDKSIIRLKKAVISEPEDARAYSLLVKAYAYKNEIDSARKYMEITDRLNPDIIEREIREYILR